MRHSRLYFDAIQILNVRRKRAVTRITLAQLPKLTVSPRVALGRGTSTARRHGRGCGSKRSNRHRGRPQYRSTTAGQQTCTEHADNVSKEGGQQRGVQQKRLPSRGNPHHSKQNGVVRYYLFDGV